MKPGYQTTLPDGMRATRVPGPDEPTIGEVVHTRPQTTMSGFLYRLDRFEKAVAEREFKGGQPTEDRDQIEKDYQKARKNLVAYVEGRS